MAVPEEFMPSKFQSDLWSQQIIVTDGTDEEGYWHGWCPLHDNENDHEVPSALINFQKGVLKCLGEPCCHKGRAISLENVLIRMYKK